MPSPGLDTRLGPGQDSLVRCVWIYSDPCSFLVWGHFHSTQLTLTVSFIAHKTALWHLTHCCPLFLASFHADYVVVPVTVSHIRQMFMVICSCFCGNVFFILKSYFSYEYFKNFTNTVLRPPSLPMLKYLVDCYFCFVEGVIFLGCFFHPIYLILTGHLLCPSQRQEYGSSGETSGCGCCSGGVQSLAMLQEIYCLDSQPVICLLFHVVSQRIQLKHGLLGQLLPVTIPLRSSFHKKPPLLSVQHILQFSKTVFSL